MHNYLADTLPFQAKNNALALKFAQSVVRAPKGPKGVWRKQIIFFAVF